MSAYIPVALQRQVRDYFQNRCAYCQTAEWLTTSTFEYEHIVPIAAGGGTLFANLCLACPTCNRYKASRQFIWDDITQEATPFTTHTNSVGANIPDGVQMPMGLSV